MSNDKYSLIRVVAACPQVRTADIDTNVANISETCHRLERECKPSVMVFPGAQPKRIHLRGDV